MITFDVSVEDCVAWNLHYLRAERARPGARVNRLLWYLLTAALLLLVVTEWLKASLWFGVPFALLWGALWYPLNAVIVRRCVARAVQRNHRGDKGTVIGRHTLEIRDGRLWETTAVDESSTALTALAGLDSTPDYLFVRKTWTVAWIVARSAVISGDLDAFERALLDAMDAARFPGAATAE